MVNKLICRSRLNQQQSIETASGAMSGVSSLPELRRRFLLPQFGHSFTLIECLFCIAVIAILVSLLLPALTKARQRAKNVTCSSNLRTMNQMIQQYSLDWEDIIPSSGLDVENYVGALLKGRYLPPGNQYVSMCPMSNLATSENLGKAFFIRNYSYGINYLGSWRNGGQSGSIKMTVTGATSDDMILNFKQLRFPSRFVLLLDTKKKNYWNNGPKAVFWGGDVGTWGANPWIVHAPNAVAAAYGDGHVQMASRTQLKEQVNTNVKFALSDIDPL